MITGIQHHIAVEVDNLLHIAQRHIQQDCHVAGDALQIPNMRDRGCKLDEAHAVPAHPAFSDLNATALTDNAAVTHPFVFAAMAFPVFGRAENLFTEQPVHLGLESSVIDGLRLGDLTHHLAIGQGALTPLHHPIR